MPLLKLSHKIFAAVFLGTILNLIAVSFFAYHFTVVTLEKSTMDSQLEIARHGMDKVDRMLNERCLETQILAGVKPFEAYLASAEGPDREQLKKIAAKRMIEVQDLTGPWDLLHVTDRDGIIVLSSDEEEVGKKVTRVSSGAEAFERAMKEDIYYSDRVEYDGNSTVLFSAPIRNTGVSGRPVIGVVIGFFSWPAVLEQLEEISTPAALINREGEVIGSNREFAETHPKVKMLEEDEFMENLKHGKSLSFMEKDEDNWLGAEELVSMAAQSGYLFYRGSGWGLVLGRSSNIAFAPAATAALRLVLFLIPIILLTSVPILILIFRWVTEPIHALTQTTKFIAAGNWDKKVAVTSRDEMGELGESFNRMTEKLRSFYDHLEAQVEERTSDLLKANEAIKESESKSRLIIETANDAFISIDAESKVIEWNSQSESMFGWTRGEAVGKSLPELIIPAQYREAHLKGMQKYLKTGEGPVIQKQIEISALNRSGNEFPIEITIWPVTTRRGLFFNAFIRDVSQRKKLEGAMLQSEKMSAIGQLAAGVAHEINNPLGVILGFAQGVVKRIQPGDPWETPLKAIEREAVRCKKLVQDLLIFSRVSKTHREDMDLNQTVEGALSLIEAQTKVKNISLIRQFGTNLPRMFANSGQIQQVIINLCNNAIDAIPNGGTVTIRTQEASVDGRACLEIDVEDTGVGIAPEIQSQIFVPFFTTKEVGKGTGLGLSLAYEIVEKHEGKISFDTQAGRGTAFHIFLPLP